MVVSIHPRRSGMAKGQRAILHSIRRPLRANARSHFRPRQPDSFEDAQRRDQLRFLLKRISRADRKMAGRKIEGSNGMFHEKPKVDNSVPSPQRRGERGGSAENNLKSLPLSLRFLRVLRASAAPTQKTLLFFLLFLLAPAVIAQTIRVNPTGVNVNVSGATTVFLTFGPVRNFRPPEGSTGRDRAAIWASPTSCPFRPRSRVAPIRRRRPDRFRAFSTFATSSIWGEAPIKEGEAPTNMFQSPAGSPAAAPELHSP